jgi:acetate kinase
VRLLIFNAGSSSLKFELLDLENGPARRVVSGAFSEDGAGQYRLKTDPPGPGTAPHVRTLAEAASYALDWLAGGAGRGPDLLATVEATAHRIVHGGARFHRTTRLGDAELAALSELSPLAPLHNPPALAVVGAVRARLGSTLPLVGVFDTAFFAQLPESAYRYAIPADWSQRLGVRRYGFHGIAHRFLCQQARALLGARVAEPRIISLQLGRGCSVTATVIDRPVATSMGFTPLEGLVMGTRSGDFDPGAMLYVMGETGMAPDAMRRELNENSGLLGLSGRSADMRELLALERSRDPGATLAVEVFCRRARHYLGGFLAELGGADAIVFGGGIGENCADIRRRIVGRLEWAGIRLRAEPADAGMGATALHDPASSAAVYVVPVDEGAVIAEEARSVLQCGAGA